MVRRVAIASGLFLFLVACSASESPSPHLHDKATVSERAASSDVGGFNDDETRLYHLGMLHITKAHGKPGSFTIRQVVDQEQGRENARSAERQRLADAQAAAEQKARERQERVAYEAAHHDYCGDAMNDEHIASSSSSSHQTAYDASVKGLAANDQCTDEDSHLGDEGYLLSMKALAEHYFSGGDARTDFNQANALLVECQTRPRLYGTRVGASCETQEQNNIQAQTNWEMESNE
jgi:hypothetical protein